MLDSLSPKEKDLLQLVLGGGSVIDRRRGYFSQEKEVLHFLRINEFDLSRQKDNDRLMGIHNEAAGYLQRELRIDLPAELLKADKPVSFFLLASGSGDRKLQSAACTLLKTMNIINHIDGRELLYNCPISLRDLFGLVEDKVERSLSVLSRREPLLKYQGGRKPKESLITKLLCKRETIAAQIYDRVRYRIVTNKKEDIVKVILHLFDTVLPFNYIIPGVSVNQLIPLKRREKLSAVLSAVKRRLPPPPMEYTGRDYRVCKFVVDIPLRMDNFLASSAGPVYRESLGNIAYVLVEFQIVDQESDLSNNSGECSHENYKKRQKKGVIRRLKGN